MHKYEELISVHSQGSFKVWVPSLSESLHNGSSFGIALIDATIFSTTYLTVYLLIMNMYKNCLPRSKACSYIQCWHVLSNETFWQKKRQRDHMKQHFTRGNVRIQLETTYFLQQVSCSPWTIIIYNNSTWQLWFCIQKKLIELVLGLDKSGTHLSWPFYNFKRWFAA